MVQLASDSALICETVGASNQLNNVIIARDKSFKSDNFNGID